MSSPNADSCIETGITLKHKNFDHSQLPKRKLTHYGKQFAMSHWQRAFNLV